MNLDTDRYAISEYDLAEIFGVSRRRIQQHLESAHRKIAKELGPQGIEMLRVMDLARRQSVVRRDRRRRRSRKTKS